MGSASGQELPIYGDGIGELAVEELEQEASSDELIDRIDELEEEHGRQVTILKDAFARYDEASNDD